MISLQKNIKEKCVLWVQEHTEDCNAVKQEITSAPMLQYYNLSKSFGLQISARNVFVQS